MNAGLAIYRNISYVAILSLNVSNDMNTLICVTKFRLKNELRLRPGGKPEGAAPPEVKKMLRRSANQARRYMVVN